MSRSPGSPAADGPTSAALPAADGSDATASTSAGGSVATLSHLRVELTEAVAAAEAAGELLLDAFGQPSAERRKGPHDVVTELDRAAERLIFGRLAAAFPADRRLGEETGWSATPRGGGSDRTWIVDPLDGTINYASGLPIWCVSIALAIGPTVVLGVIRDAVHGATFGAIRGSGAWHLPDLKNVSVRRLRRGADAVLSADPGAEADTVADARIRAIRPRVRSIRVPGSIAWSLTALATGRLDGVLQVRGLQAVDVAAAGLIALEAGATVTAADGGPWVDIANSGAGRGIAAGRPAIHRLLVSDD
jgi:fructose-1,6-bisphosphatase/inositol monophosphatase family enzyme